MMTKKQNGQFTRKECYIPVSEIKDIKKNIKKKRTKKPITPRSKVRAMIRLLFLRSREHAFVIKRDKNTCQNCGAKGSKAKGREVKINVHHLDFDNMGWQQIIDRIFATILCHPDRMICVCEDCHNQIHGREVQR